MKRAALAFAILALVFVPVTFVAAQAAKYNDGVYTLNYEDAELGKVTVSVTVTGGRLSAVTLPEGKGDVAIDDAPLAAWLKAFVAAPDFMTVDVVSGASQSCDLIKYAVQNALKKALAK